MKSRKAILIFFTVLFVSALACNVGVPAPSSLSPRDAAATIVAQTLQAQGLPTSQGLILNSPVPLASPTFSTPMLTISAATNCRSGPSANYEIITSAPAGTVAEIVGKDTADNYWLIKTPNGTGTCWMSGQYAAPSGAYAALPEVTPEATKAAGLPAKPGSIGWQFSCSRSGAILQITTTLTWADSANNENGYRVFRSSSLIAELPANSTTYTDTTSTTPGGNLSYSVTAFNNSGESVPSVRNFTNNCQ